ncbi:hypothetical protein [Mycobacteroides franklinii]
MAADCSVAAYVDDVVEAPQASLGAFLAVVHRQPTTNATALTQAT